MLANLLLSSLALTVCALIAATVWHGFIWLGLVGAILFFLAVFRGLWEVAAGHRNADFSLEDDDQDDSGE